jgi:hypothetical protein
MTHRSLVLTNLPSDQNRGHRVDNENSPLTPLTGRLVEEALFAKDLIAFVGCLDASGAKCVSCEQRKPLVSGGWRHSTRFTAPVEINAAKNVVRRSAIICDRTRTPTSMFRS